MAATHGNSVALSCLTAAIDTNRLPRKAIADDLGKTQQTLSKMEAGTQAFGLDDFERLPHDIQVQWMKTYGKDALGLQVRELDPLHVSEELLALVDRLATIVKLARIVGRPVQAKADLSHDAEERKRA